MSAIESIEVFADAVRPAGLVYGRSLAAHHRRRPQAADLLAKERMQCVWQHS